jgi:hypothetical protein
MKKYVWCVLLFSLLCFSGCGHLDEYLEIARNDTVSKEYMGALDKWTRQKTVYSEFETKARIVATYESKEFKDAFFSEYSRIYFLTGKEEQLKQNVVVNRGYDFTELLFYAYIPDRDANDFARIDSVWSVFLSNEKGERVDPEEIKEIQEITPLIKELFPYVNPYYGKFYNVRFSQPDQTEEEIQNLKLVFTGVLGKVELEWKHWR